MEEIIFLDDKNCIQLNFENRREFPEYSMFAIEGFLCFKEEEWEVDCIVSCFYKMGETKAENYICYEQDDAEKAIVNIQNLFREKKGMVTRTVA